jgi:hypothetical protein
VNDVEDLKKVRGRVAAHAATRARMADA